jgi:hypothetical protein
MRWEQDLIQEEFYLNSACRHIQEGRPTGAPLSDSTSWTSSRALHCIIRPKNQLDSGININKDLTGLCLSFKARFPAAE